MNIENMVGRHLMIDGLVVSPHNLNSSDLLEDIVHGIDMTMILPPIAVNFPHAICEMNRILSSLEKEGLAKSSTAESIRNHLANRKLQTYGYSSIVMLAESHISLHTFPEQNFFTFDCYSCKDFDSNVVLDIVRSYFPELKFIVNDVVRYMPLV
jgi:S-adenosylmethionine decarboxylase